MNRVWKQTERGWEADIPVLFGCSMNQCPENKSCGCSLKQSMPDQTPQYEICRRRKRRKKRKTGDAYYD